MSLRPWTRLVTGVLICLAVLCLASACTAVPAGRFTAFAPPLGAPTDVVTGLPTCGSLVGIGPVGLLDDGSSLYVSDWCTATTYRYQLGDPATLTSVRANGLSHALLSYRGRYFGIADTHQTIAPAGVYEFDPETLELTRRVLPGPCPDTRGLATDPRTGAVFVTGDCGLWRIGGIDNATPFVSRVRAGNMDGIAVDPQGNLWVAEPGFGVRKFDQSGTLLASLSVPDFPSGLALAGPVAPPAVVGKLFANDIDGVISLIDTDRPGPASAVATGGSRGDFAIIGPDGFLYATQSDRVVRFPLTGTVGGRVAGATGAPRQVAYRLILAFTLLGLTCAALAVWAFGRRRASSKERSSMNQELVKQLAREIVAEAAPSELPVFEELARAALQDGDRPGRAASGRDEPTQFWVFGVAATMTPAAIWAAIKIVDLVTDKAMEKTMERLHERWRIRRRRRRSEKARLVEVDNLAPLVASAGPLALDEIHREVVGLLGARGCDAHTAESVAAVAVALLSRPAHPGLAIRDE
jgi:hypothetical protein